LGKAGLEASGCYFCVMAVFRLSFVSLVALALFISSAPLRAQSPTAMVPYHDLDGDSGIQAYAIAPERMDIMFKRSGKIFTYWRAEVGDGHFLEMCRLAKLGNGLNAYINKHVRRK
jgi:hypothetical protein